MSGCQVDDIQCEGYVQKDMLTGKVVSYAKYDGDEKIIFDPSGKEISRVKEMKLPSFEEVQRRVREDPEYKALFQ